MEARGRSPLDLPNAKRQGKDTYFVGHVKLIPPQPAILNFAKSCSSPRNAGMVMTSEQPKRAKAVER
jgi:hypothetical protein